MTVGGFLSRSFLPLILALAACAPVETKTTLMTPVDGKVRSAGPGDTVMAFQAQRPLPNAFGRADIFGRTTNAGQITVRYVGTQGTQALFERAGVTISSNATTMSETPLIIPQTSNTTMTGSVGTTPVMGSSTTTSYQVMAPRGSSEYVMPDRPIQFLLGAGQSVPIEGKTLRVMRVSPLSVDYLIE